MQPPQALREGDGEHQGRSEKEMGKGSTEESRIATILTQMRVCATGQPNPSLRTRLLAYGAKDPHESALRKHPRLPQQPFHVRER